MEALLTVSDLEVHLGGAAVFQKLSFELQRGETLVILGPNGAGKTVLLRTLLGLIPHSGTISWQKGTKLGYVPQRVPLNKDLPVSVTDFFGLKDIPPEEVPTILSAVGISDALFQGKQLGSLSSGQFQRILIAFALAKDPDALLFDEPTAGIDVSGEETIQHLLERTQSERNIAMILVTHDLSAVYREATHVLCMNNKTSCYGTPNEVLTPEILKRIYGMEIKFFRHAHE